MTRRFAIGLGCRRGCSAAALVDLIREACATVDFGAAALFTIDTKRGEPGLHEAAATLGLPLGFLPAGALAAVADRVTHRSDRVLAATGVPSVAEAAALVGAGRGGCLVVPRRVGPGATCAVAETTEAGP